MHLPTFLYTNKYVNKQRYCFKGRNIGHCIRKGMMLASIMKLLDTLLPVRKQREMKASPSEMKQYHACTDESSSRNTLSNTTTVSLQFIPNPV